MSLDTFKKIIYEDLPSQHLAIVDGGVLIYPEMFGLDFSLNMKDEEFYRYLVLFSSVTEVLSKAKSQKHGEELIKLVCAEISVDPSEFKKNTINLLMLESILQGRVIPMDLDSVRNIYATQSDKAKRIVEDMKHSIDPQVVKSAFKFSHQEPKKQVVKSKPVEKKKEIVLVKPEDNSQNEIKVEDKKDESLFSKTVSIIKKPPVAIGLIALGCWTIYKMNSTQ